MRLLIAVIFIIIVTVEYKEQSEFVHCLHAIEDYLLCFCMYTWLVVTTVTK